MKILSDRMLRIKGSAEHSRGTCVDRPSRSAGDQLHNNAPHRSCLEKTNTAWVTLFVFFTVRRGTFPYSIEDDASTTSQTPIIHYTNTCVKLTTLVTHLSFSERIAIANLCFYYIYETAEVRDVRRNGGGRGLCGGPEKEWMECFLDDRKAFGINADQWTTAAQDEGE